MIGRWRSGAPLSATPDRDDPKPVRAKTSFLYRGIDPDGMRCPLGAHIRRANPRDMLGDDPEEGLMISRRHRLIRRGRSYGPRLPEESDKAGKESNKAQAGGAPLDSAESSKAVAERQPTALLRPQKPIRGLLFMAINANYRAAI